MPKATKAQEQVMEQVGAAYERIVSLKREGNDDGAAELNREAESLISGLTGAGSVAIKKSLRDEIRDAMATERAAATEVALRETQDVSAVEWLDELVSQGSKQVQMVAETNERGNKSIANIMLDVRRRITLEDGTPDLKATSALAKAASREIYARVIKDLPADSDVVKAVNRVQRQAQNTMVDLRVAYAKSLDEALAADASEEEREAHAAELALYSGVEREEGQTLSEAIAAHYGFKLATRSELTMAARERKELEAKSDSDEGSSEAASEPKSPAVALAEAVATMARQLVVIESLPLDEAMSVLDTERREGLLIAITDHIEGLKAAYDRLETAADAVIESSDTEE